MERDAIDFGSLKVSVLFRRLFIPTLCGMLSISAVTVADGIFVGQGVGSDGIAAVNIYVPLLMVFQGMGFMIGIGCSVVASIHLSQSKIRAARLNVTQAMVFVTAVTLLLSSAILLFPDRTAVLLGASEHLLPLVKDYLLWFTPALVFQMWTAVGLFVIRLDGAPKLAMWCSVISALLNVLLDWLFIFPLGRGVMGAAFATAISVSVGGGIALWYLLCRARSLSLCPLKGSRKSLRLSLRNVGYQCRIGSSALLGEATLATLMFTGNQVFMRYLGDDGVGAFGIACYYIPFVFMVGNAIAQSAQPIISYNFGAGASGRVIQARRIALATAVVCGMTAMGLFVCCPRILGLLAHFTQIYHLYNLLIYNILRRNLQLFITEFCIFSPCIIFISNKNSDKSIEILHISPKYITSVDNLMIHIFSSTFNFLYSFTPSDRLESKS